MKDRVFSFTAIAIITIVAILVIIGLVLFFWEPAKENLAYLGGSISNLIPTA